MKDFRMIAAFGTATTLGAVQTALLDNYVKIYGLGELI